MEEVQQTKMAIERGERSVQGETRMLKRNVRNGERDLDDFKERDMRL
jgi:hypothetical protein